MMLTIENSQLLIILLLLFILGELYPADFLFYFRDVTLFENVSPCKYISFAKNVYSNQQLYHILRMQFYLTPFYPRLEVSFFDTVPTSLYFYYCI